MALDEDTHLFRRALRKHDRRLDKQVGAARRLRRAERRAGDATPSSPTFHGPTVASVGRRGGGLGETRGDLGRGSGIDGALEFLDAPREFFEFVKVHLSVAVDVEVVEEFAGFGREDTLEASHVGERD